MTTSHSETDANHYRLRRVPPPAEAAGYYASLGLRPIRVEPAGKAPVDRDWPRMATADQSIVAERFAGWSGNVGVAMGAGTIIDIETDPHNGGDDGLRELEVMLGSLPDTWTFLSGRGGRHQLFRAPAFRVITCANLGAELIGRPSGVDLRGDGGQAVFPPSMHANGRLYEWTKLDPDALEIGELPEKWLDYLEQRSRGAAAKPAAPAAGQVAPAGGRHEWVLEMTRSLARLGMPRDMIVEATAVLMPQQCDMRDGREVDRGEIARAADGALRGWQDRHAVAVAHGAAVVAEWHPVTQPDAEPSGIVLRTHEDRLRDCLNPPPMIVHGLLPVGGIGALIAMPGHGKTLAGLELARCVALGHPFAEREVKKGKVVYLCTDAPADTERRMLALGEAGEAILSVAEAPILPGGGDELVAALDRAGDGVRLVVLDTWDSSREHAGGGWSDQDGLVERIMRGLRKLAQTRGMAVLILHHASKGDGEHARGSAVFDARLDWAATVRKDGDVVSLDSYKCRSGPTGEIGRWRVVAAPLPGAQADDPVPRLEAASLLEAAATQGHQAIERRQALLRQALAVLAAVPPGAPLTKRGIMDALGIRSSRAIADLAEALRARGWLVPGQYLLSELGRSEASKKLDL
jgi:hypothetical protein